MLKLESNKNEDGGVCQTITSGDTFSTWSKLNSIHLSFCHIIHLLFIVSLSVFFSSYLTLSLFWNVHFCKCSKSTFVSLCLIVLNFILALFASLEFYVFVQNVPLNLNFWVHFPSAISFFLSFYCWYFFLLLFLNWIALKKCVCLEFNDSDRHLL